MGLACVLFIAGFSATYGQVFEDRMEPDEMGIGDIDSLSVPAFRYVGNDSCKTCHPAAYRKWLGMKHARAFVSLRSRMAVTIGERDSITASSPDRSGRCLSCHAVAHDAPAAYRGPGVRIGEGVTCEKCHGPGEKHVADLGSFPGRAWTMVRMISVRVARTILGRPDMSVDLEMPVEADCMACHKSKPSHEMPGKKPFSFSNARKKIAHPEE